MRTKTVILSIMLITVFLFTTGTARAGGPEPFVLGALGSAMGYAIGGDAAGAAIGGAAGLAVGLIIDSQDYDDDYYYGPAVFSPAFAFGPVYRGHYRHWAPRRHWHGNVAPRFAHRRIHQHKRIHDGVVRGDLTRREKRFLRHDQRHIQQFKRAALRDDGKFSPGERARLNKLQNRASRDIYRLKHN